MTPEEEFHCLSLYITYIETVQPKSRLMIGRFIAAWFVFTSLNEVGKR